MWKKIVLLGLLAFVAHNIYCLGVILGFHVTIYKHYPGPCRKVPNIEHGSEDMVSIPGDKALISSGLRYLGRHSPHFANSTARIFLFDFIQPQKPAQNVAFKGFGKDLKDCDFHGMAVWVEKETGVVTIFIVNHLETESVVEIFEFDDKDIVLVHQETVGSSDPNFHFLNDVEAFGPRQFYATNNYYSRKTFQFEFYLHLKWGSVVYYDGSKSHLAATGLVWPNGLAKSPDGRHIYVSNIGEREVVTFTRNEENRLLVKERTPLYTLPDNILTDPDTGDLWIGASPIGHLVLQYLENPQHKSPSQVLHLRTKDGSITSIAEVLVDDGKLIPASTVALYRKNQVLIGSVASNAIVCEVKYI